MNLYLNIGSFIVPFLVVIPMLFGVIISLLSKKTLLCSRLYSLMSMIIFALSIVCIKPFFQHNSIDVLGYDLGGFGRFGISFRIYYISAFGLFTISLCNLIRAIIPVSQLHKLSGLHFALQSMIVAGLIGMCITNDLFNFYVFVEMSAISSYVLSVNRLNSDSYHSAFEYLIIGSIAGLMMLIGIAILYAIFGTLNISEIHASILVHKNEFKLISYSMIFFIFGILIKIAAVPFHSWYINVNKTVDYPILTFFTYTNSTIASIVLIKFLYLMYDMNFLINHAAYFISILQVLGTLSIILGSFYAMSAKHFTSLIAWSSVAQSGYVLIAIASNNPIMLQGAIMLIISTAISKLLICIMHEKIMANHNVAQLNIAELSKFDFSGFRMPMIILVFNMAGLPMTIGFMAKLYMIIGSILSNNIGVFVIILFGSVLSAIYSFRLIEQIIAGNHSETTDNKIIMNYGFFTRIVYILVATTLLFAIFLTKFTMHAKKISASLFTSSQMQSEGMIDEEVVANNLSPIYSDPLDEVDKINDQEK